ncbi:aspartate 1-decarboxylase [Candidatus Omnitrophota bacterium]
MLQTMCKSKIANARITQTELRYEGSITIDGVLLDEVNILPGEKVEVLNFNNGSRVETYAIRGEDNSGLICLNGPAAHTGKVGDELIILAYCFAEEKEAPSIKTKIVYCDERNKIKNSALR